MASDYTAPRLYDLRDLRVTKIGSDETSDYFALPVALYGAASGSVIVQSSENFIGVVGGDSEVITITGTSTAALYSIGHTLGGKLTLTNAMRVAGGSGVLHSVTIDDKSNTRPTGQIVIFGSNPSNSTLTDRATAVVADGDVPKMIGVIPVTNSYWYQIASKGIMSISGIGMMVQSATGTRDLYAMFYLDSTPTPSGTADFTYHFGLMRD